MHPAAAFLSPDDITLVKAAEQPGGDAELFLKYQSHDGNYWIFYDLEGSALFVRYRLDRWDYSRDRLRDSLRQGITYKLRLKNLKKLPEGNLPPGVTGSGIPQLPVQRKIRRIRDVFSGDFAGINESALRDLRY